MKISELSEVTGAPTPTIKFYLRDGLIPTGLKTSRNQSQYDKRHVEMINFINMLKPHMSLEEIREILKHDDYIKAAADAIKAKSNSFEALLGDIELLEMEREGILT